MPEKTVTLLFSSDLAITEKESQKIFLSQSIYETFKGLSEYFHTTDLFIANLESVLYDNVQSTSVEKVGPHLSMPTESIRKLKEMNIGLLNLANNHIGDYGDEGIRTTIEQCAKEHIRHIGVGNNLTNAQHSVSIKRKGITFDIVAVAEHEFSIATEKNYGANPYDLKYLTKFLLNSRTDIKIILIHGGNETFEYPNVQLRDDARYLCDIGADIVIVNHSHRPGCYEMYDESFIVYGQGNFLLDYPVDKRYWPDWDKGFLVQVEVSGKGVRNFTLIPYIKAADELGCMAMGEADAKQFLELIKPRQAILNDDALLYNEWIKYCHRNIYKINSFSHIDTFLDKVIRKLFSQYFYVPSFSKRKHMLNNIQCEAHRNLLLSLLQNYSDEKRHIIDEKDSVVKK
jgi:hypothetical protein